MAEASTDRRSISRGETLGFLFEPEIGPGRQELPDDLSCELHLTPRRGGGELITPRTIERDDSADRFTGHLTSEETQDLEPGHYFLVGVITAQDYRRELAVRFRVREAWRDGGE